MRIIAIDPGYERLGVAVLEKERGEKERLLFSSCITTSRSMPHEKRLLAISGAIRSCIEKHAPDALAIEKLFFVTNQKTAFAVAEARGVILAEAARAGLAVYEYTPLQIKIAVTGYGRSDKKQVTEMVKKLIEIPEKKSLPVADSGTPFTKGRIRLDDEYDAIAVGLTCLATQSWNMKHEAF